MASSIQTQRNLKEEITLTPNGFLFDHVTGLTYTVNSTGGLILKHLMDGESAPATIKALTSTFDVGESIAQKDLEEFLEQVRAFGVL
ncbi:MAG: PqqD family protein [Ignavibacteriae bacterium]|nr:PqqD family protein [Ignavibacteriota bacterium]